MSNSTRSQILFALIAGAVVPLIALGIVSATLLRSEVHHSELGRIEALNKELGRQVGIVMERAVEVMGSLQSHPYFIDGEVAPAERLAEMERLVSVYDMFSDITLYDSHGDILNSTSFNQSAVFENTAWFSDALDGKLVISSPEFIRGEGGLFLTVYLKVTGLEGERARVIKGRIGFDQVNSLLSDADLGNGGMAVLLDEHGNVLSHVDPDRVYEKFDRSVKASVWMEEATGEYRLGDEDYIYASQVLAAEETAVGSSWILLSLVPKSEIDAIVMKASLIHLAFALGAAVVLSVVGLILARRISRPIVSAASAAERVALGDLEVRVEGDGSKEMVALADSFNNMVDEVRSTRKGLEQRVEDRTRQLRHSEAELRSLASQLRAAYEAAQEGILVSNLMGGVVTANRKLAEIFPPLPQGNGTWDGWSHVADRISARLVEREKFLDFWRRMREDSAAEGLEEWELVGDEPGIVSIFSAPVCDTGGNPEARLWMVRDLTEQRQLQEGLQQAQKMEAVGRLAGGVAHDFNNLLTGIIGNLALVDFSALELANEDEGNRIVAAKKAALRGADLVKQLLGFSRRSFLELKSCSVNDFILDLRDLLSASIDPRVALKTDLAEDLWKTMADANKLEQVVMNMCVNAVDAMGAVGGSITLRTRNVRVDDLLEFPDREEATIGNYIRIDVSDNGSGMPEGVRKKVFEPFFTTKEQGKGTGLGLATSYGIVKQHDGWITCQSELGKGTEFSIYLPQKVFDVPDVSSIAPAQSEVGAAVTQPAFRKGEGERVLIVDDDLVVRSVAQGVLKKGGYEIVCASDGQEGLDRLAEDDSFELILMDLTMPRMSGKEAFSALRKRGDLTPVLICSGYLLDIDVFSEEAGARPEAFVQKPYDPNQLLETVRRLIDESKKGECGRRGGVVPGAKHVEGASDR